MAMEQGKDLCSIESWGDDDFKAGMGLHAEVDAAGAETDADVIVERGLEV